MKCPICASILMKYIHQQNFFACYKCGLIFRVDVKHNENSFYDIVNIEESNFYNICKHYNTLKDFLIKSFKEDIFDKNIKYDIISFSCNYPFFELLFNTSRINMVIDIEEKDYINKIYDLYQKYNGHNNIELLFIDASNNESDPFINIHDMIVPDKMYLLSFVHILNKLDVKSLDLLMQWICKILNMYANIDVIFYIPNIEMAKDNLWHHFKYPLNITFPKRKFFDKYFESKMFDVLFLNYSDDVLYFLRKKKSFLLNDVSR